MPNDRGSIQARLERFKTKVTSLMVKEYRQFERRMILYHLSGHSATSLGRRTGALARTLRIRGPEVQGNRIRVGALIGFAGVPYARIHEYGGTIRPKNKRALAVPIGAALTRAGVSKMGPRSYGDLFMVKRKGKPPLLVRLGKGYKSMTPMFVLVPKVTIPPRLNFRKTWKEAADLMKLQINAMAKEAFGKGVV